MDILGTLKSKVYGIPVWLIALFVVLGGAIYIRHRNAANATAATGTAANQANTNLGTASALQNMFTTAGIMPYQGGNTYVNTTGQTQPDQPVVVNVGHNQPVQQVINWAQKNGYPNFTWADFWALNPNLINEGLQNINNTWTLTQWSTPITIYKPGTVQSGTGGISGDYAGTSKF